MSDPQVIAELQAEVRRLAAAQRRRTVVQSTLVAVAVVLAAGASLAQPVITTFVADQPAQAASVNGNFSQLAAFSVPKNGIIFFDGVACPTGWTQVAQGRAIVGRPSTGTIGSTYGTAIIGNTEPSHSHSEGSAGGHNHGGETGTFSNWDTGTINWTLQVGYTSAYHHRHVINSDGAHTHTINGLGAGSVLPYVYYTACRKD